MPNVSVQGLIKDIAGHRVLDGISLDVADGEFFTLLGPSGCGKSTTLSCIAGLERPTRGRITVGDRAVFDGERGVDVPTEARQLGFVFQSYALWPHMTVDQNVTWPLRLRKVDKRVSGERLAELLERLALKGLEKRYPHQLSGGQQQRVALARALSYSPQVLLLDEPLSNLDAQLREQARGWLKELQQDFEVTTLYVTHDQIEALSLSDRIAVMQAGQMLQIGTPQEIYERPASLAVARFVGNFAYLPGTVSHVWGKRVELRLEDGQSLRAMGGTDLRPGCAAVVAMRVDPIQLNRVDGQADDQVMLRALVKRRRYAGSHFVYDVRVGSSDFVASSPERIEPGDVTITLGHDTALVFGEPFDPREVADGGTGA